MGRRACWALLCPALKLASVERAPLLQPTRPTRRLQRNRLPKSASCDSHLRTGVKGIPTAFRAGSPLKYRDGMSLAGPTLAAATYRVEPLVRWTGRTWPSAYSSAQYFWDCRNAKAIAGACFLGPVEVTLRMCMHGLKRPCLRSNC